MSQVSEAKADAKGNGKPSTATSTSTSTPSAPTPFVSRNVDKYIESKEQSEGVGARVRRSIGGSQLRNFDPFLMLDEFRAGPPAGFPDHPHRGFETVTYMIDGAFEHEDFMGHRGKINSGDLQWMTAGKGIVHSEMPASKGISHGLQLWVNLPKKDKMCEPAYQELKASEITTVEKDGVTAIVIAGEALGHKSKVYTRNPTYYIHFKMAPNTKLQQPIPQGHSSFAYTLSGEALFGDSKHKAVAHHVLTLTPGNDKTPADGLLVQTTDKPIDFVLLSGQPIGEPVFQHGPFVMTTQNEIYQALTDYQYGRNGFEKAPGWRSEIGRPITDKQRADDHDEL